jgi:hypothetical protein
MIDGGNYHLEVADRLATLYVIGNVPAAAARLIALCDDLPRGVEILTVNLDEAEQMGQVELSMIDALRTHWQRTRRGPLRVAFSLLSPTRQQAYKIRLGT